MRLLFCAVALILCGLQVHGAKNTQASIWKKLEESGVGANFLPGSNDTINLNLKFTLITLSDYEDKLGTMRMGYWMTMTWTIPGVKWDPKEFNSVANIAVTTDKLWVPDVVPYKHTEFEHAKETRVLLYSNGYTMWVPHLMSTILCEDVVDGPRYPRDQKVCRIRFGSWVYHGFLLNLTHKTDPKFVEELDSKPLKSSGWKFLKANTKYHARYYPCCKEPYPAVDMEIYIERTDVYFSLAISVPGVVVGLIVALLYLVPTTSPARITSQCICLLIIVFVGVTDLRMIGSTVLMAPAAHYFMGAMIIDLFAVFWSILTAVAWMQTSVKGPHGRGSMDSMLSKLECICCLPSFTVQQDHLQLELDERTEENVQVRVVGLSGVQRFILVLDRLFCVISIILLLFLFIYLGV